MPFWINGADDVRSFRLGRCCPRHSLISLMHGIQLQGSPLHFHQFFVYVSEKSVVIQHKHRVGSKKAIKTAETPNLWNNTHEQTKRQATRQPHVRWPMLLLCSQSAGSDVFSVSGSSLSWVVIWAYLVNNWPCVCPRMASSLNIAKSRHTEACFSWGQSTHAMAVYLRHIHKVPRILDLSLWEISHSL